MDNCKVAESHLYLPYQYLGLLLRMCLTHFMLTHSAAPLYNRRSLKTGEYLQAETIALCATSLFASLMFDEASNLQMVGLLNVFVNVHTKDLRVSYIHFRKIFVINTI